MILSGRKHFSCTYSKFIELVDVHVGVLWTIGRGPFWDIHQYYPLLKIG